MNMKCALPAIGLLLLLSAAPALAEDEEKLIAAKSGETVDVMPVYGAPRCRSVLTATPEVEVLQGPPEIKLSVREAMVTPPKCREKVKGGIVVATVGQVKQPTDGKLIFRVKYHTKDGPIQTGQIRKFTLLP